MPSEFDILAIQSLATVLRESCPHLQELIFFNLVMGHRGLQTLLAFQTHDTIGDSVATTHWLALRTLRLQRMDVLLEHVLQILETGLDSLKDTLEVLVVTLRQVSPYWPSTPRIAWVLHTFSRLVNVLIPPGVVNLHSFYRDNCGNEEWIPWACKDSIELVDFQIECLDPEWEQYKILEYRGDCDDALEYKDYRDQKYVDLMLETCPGYGRVLQVLNTMPKLSLRHVRYVR